MHVFGFISKPWSNVFKMVASLCVIVARQFFIDSPDMIPSTKHADTTGNILEPKRPVLLWGFDAHIAG